MEVYPADGIPLESDYKRLIKSDYFKSLENYSDEFLFANQKHLRSFTNRWVGDSLHQWSRQWEYPYVLSRVSQVIRKNSGARILDAGSGITFFPYYLKAQFSSASIFCCDYDETLKDVFENINDSVGESVKFSVADLKFLPYEKEEYDVVYCISVLEHTGDYERIIDEFYSILRPGGKLIVTFDVSLDGTRDINVENGTALLSALGKRFDMDNESALDLRSQASAPGIFTTLAAKNIDANLLPWRYPSLIYRMKSLLATGKLCSWPPPLTVFCLCLTKPPASL